MRKVECKHFSSFIWTGYNENRLKLGIVSFVPKQISVAELLLLKNVAYDKNVERLSTLGQGTTIILQALCT